MKNISYIVNRVQLGREDYSTHQVSRMTQFAIDFVKNELGLKISKSVKVAHLTPNAVNNAAFPSDYEAFTKVCINVCGQLYTLSVNKEIALNRTVECGSEVTEPNSLNDLICTCQGASVDTTTASIVTSTFPGYYVAGYFRSGQYVAEQYSLGGGFNSLGYFREDWGNRVFQFYNIPVFDSIILEYIAEDDVNNQTLIPYAAVDVAVRYVEWQMNYYDKKADQYTKEKSRGLYLKAIADYRYFVTAPTKSQYLDELWGSLQSTPKR